MIENKKGKENKMTGKMPNSKKNESKTRLKTSHDDQEDIQTANIQ